MRPRQTGKAGSTVARPVKPAGSRLHSRAGILPALYTVEPASSRLYTVEQAYLFYSRTAFLPVPDRDQTEMSDPLLSFIINANSQSAETEPRMQDADNGGF
jgi:hypothetical protein